jgi:hypothetical protein
MIVKGSVDMERRGPGAHLSWSALARASAAGRSPLPWSAADKGWGSAGRVRLVRGPAGCGAARPRRRRCGWRRRLRAGWWERTRMGYRPSDRVGAWRRRVRASRPAPERTMREALWPPVALNSGLLRRGGGGGARLRRGVRRRRVMTWPRGRIRVPRRGAARERGGHPRVARSGRLPRRQEQREQRDGDQRDDEHGGRDHPAAKQHGGHDHPAVRQNRGRPLDRGPHVSNPLTDALARRSHGRAGAAKRLAPPGRSRNHQALARAGRVGQPLDAACGEGRRLAPERGPPRAAPRAADGRRCPLGDVVPAGRGHIPVIDQDPFPHRSLAMAVATGEPVQALVDLGFNVASRHQTQTVPVRDFAFAQYSVAVETGLPSRGSESNPAGTRRKYVVPPEPDGLTANARAGRLGVHAAVGAHGDAAWSRAGHVTETLATPQQAVARTPSTPRAGKHLPTQGETRRSRRPARATQLGGACQACPRSFALVGRRAPRCEVKRLEPVCQPAESRGPRSSLRSTSPASESR